MEDSLIRWDMIVVGSGCTGAMAAQTLVERGFKVLMIDGGVKDDVYKPLLPDKDFLTARQTDKQQHRYFLAINLKVFLLVMSKPVST
jgi:choline dehydrogenase-like flavoprotein